MDRKPTGFTISTARGERIRRLDWKFGCGLHRVWFADHRSGWSGINFHIYFFSWGWHWCIIRWQNPYKVHTPLYTLRQQIDDTHNASNRAEAAEIAADIEEHARLQELSARVSEELRRRRTLEEDDTSQS